MSDKVERLTINRLGHQGDGVADGPVFVPRSLPGEIVEGVVKAGRMDAPKIIRPVPERVRPPCRHSKTCGGCALQHVRDDFLATWKAQVVETALHAQGLEVQVRGVQTSPPRSRRRAVLAARRIKSGAQVGFHGLKSDTISEISDCQLIRPELLQKIPLVRALTEAGGSRKGRLNVTLTLLDDGVDIAVVGGRSLDGPLFSRLADLARNAGGVARLSWEGEQVAAFGPARLSLGWAQLTPPPGAFVQATAEGEAALLTLVRKAVGPVGKVADLFAGIGTFALPLAEGASVHAVEGDGAMLAALAAGWRGASGLKPVTTETRDLFRRPLLPDELAAYQAVVLDPPRAGAEAQVAEIGRSGVGRVAMVSCNPVSLARDARTLCAAGFALDWVEVVDQFRWSPHVELVACFTRNA